MTSAKRGLLLLEQAGAAPTSAAPGRPRCRSGTAAGARLSRLSAVGDLVPLVRPVRQTTTLLDDRARHRMLERRASAAPASAARSGRAGRCRRSPRGAAPPAARPRDAASDRDRRHRRPRSRRRPAASARSARRWPRRPGRLEQQRDADHAIVVLGGEARSAARPCGSPAAARRTRSSAPGRAPPRAARRPSSSVADCRPAAARLLDHQAGLGAVLADRGEGRALVVEGQR